MKRNLICLCLALCLWLLPALAGTVSASAEEVYLVTEQELLQLEDNLQALKIQRRQLLTELKMLSKEHEQLAKDLAELSLLSSQQETQLKIANASLQAYASEEKRKLSKLKRQRNIGYILAAGLLYVYVKEVSK